MFVSTEEARLLLNVALMAIGRNRFGSAAKILAALERYRPQEPSLACANALLLASAQDFAGAVAFIERAERKFPESAMLQALKGMALLRMGQNAAAREPLAAAAAQTADPAAAQLAADLLK